MTGGWEVGDDGGSVWYHNYACALMQGRVVVSMSENTELCCDKHSVSSHTSLKQTNVSVTTKETTTQGWWWLGIKAVLAFRISEDTAAVDDNNDNNAFVKTPVVNVCVCVCVCVCMCVCVCVCARAYT